MSNLINYFYFLLTIEMAGLTIVLFGVVLVLGYIAYYLETGKTLEEV